MQTILVAGAGKSSTFLIKYLLSHAKRYNWKIIVADGSAEAVAEKINGHPQGEAVVLDITQTSERERLVKNADMVVSLLPPHLHILLAKDCLEHKKNLITSSYISPEMKELEKAVKEAGLMFMCEMGLDPGIDHMTANQIIHSVRKVTAEIISFKSYCGGLVAPESDDNPWHYKFSWNPKNVVTAGRGGAKYLHNGREMDIPYEDIFKYNKKVKVEGVAPLVFYPNRDSLRYLELYQLPEVHTFLRATLRHPDFCKGWNALIELGLTDQDDEVGSPATTAEWVKLKTKYSNQVSLTQHVANCLAPHGDEHTMQLLASLGLFDPTPLKGNFQNSAELLLSILLEKWEMQPDDKDMVVMQHEVEYLHRGKKTVLTSSMVVEGDNKEFSAMAKTVGLPIAILTKLFINGRVSPMSGIVIPNMPSVYRPVMTELHHHGIHFRESVA